MTSFFLICNRLYEEMYCVFLLLFLYKIEGMRKLECDLLGLQIFGIVKKKVLPSRFSEVIFYFWFGVYFSFCIVVFLGADFRSKGE